MSAYEDWTIEALKEYEERLYDLEVEGEGVWFERDQVLWELIRRSPNVKKPPASGDTGGQVYLREKQDLT